jgi:polar amino acid transport system substrate-binding protein
MWTALHLKEFIMRKPSPRPMLAGLIAALALWLVAQAARADMLDNITKAGVLKVAVVQDYPPFGSVGADMKPIGYDIDVADMLAKSLGVKVELVPVISANKIPFLVSGRADVLLNIGRNPERAKVVDFTQPYAPYYIGIFGPDDIKVAGTADLGGKSISVTRGSLEELVLTKSAPAGTEIHRYEDNNGTISAFLAGQTQLIAVGNVVAATILARSGGRKPEQKFLLMNSPVCAAVAKGEARLLDKVNAAIGQVKGNGNLNRMALKWLGQPIPPDL